MLGLKRVDATIQRGEVVVCAVALGVMILLASLQIALRWGQTAAPTVFQAVDWFDVVARLMVLWVGVVGASLAAAEGRHIAIELLPKFLGPVGRRRLDAATSLATAGVTGLILALALVFLFKSAIPDERHLFTVVSLDLKVPRWPFLVVLPLGLLIMTARFLLRGLEALLLADADYVDREAELAREVAEFERQHEAETAAQLLVQEELAARESGREPGLDPGSARAAVRELLGPPTPRSSSAVKQGPATPRGSPAVPPPPIGLSGQPRPLVGRSTDEIPVYRSDLAEEADLVEPSDSRRISPGRVVDSSDMLSTSDTSDMISNDGIAPYDELAEDAVESVAETQRLREEPEEAETTAELDAVPDPEKPKGEAP